MGIAQMLEYDVQQMAEELATSMVLTLGDKRALAEDLIDVLEYLHEVYYVEGEPGRIHPFEYRGLSKSSSDGNLPARLFPPV